MGPKEKWGLQKILSGTAPEFGPFTYHLASYAPALEYTSTTTNSWKDHVEISQQRKPHRP